MTVTKDNNQYYGKYFEKAICSVINDEEFINLTGHNFSTEDIEKMNSDAAICASVLNGSKAEWIGNLTSSANGDLIIDDKCIEVKYVSNGKGTYFNTSLEYIPNNLGFVSYREYMKEEVYPFLEKYFGSSVYENTSPVSQQESSEFRHNNEAAYKELTALDKKARKKYVADLYDFLIANPEKLARFISDCISKAPSGKEMPDELVIYNYVTNETEIISKDTINELKKNKTFSNAGLSLKFDNFRIAIGWQNGNGLNNPTIRVFIK